MSEGLVNRYLSVAHVATLLGVSEKTIYAMCQRKYLPSLKLGRRVLIDPFDLQERLAELKQRKQNESAKNSPRKIVD
ncbi:MAG: helix-turn-helix domain-containing protein [bacterium]